MLPKVPRTLSNEQEIKLVERYKKGEPPQLIWESFGISKRTFYNTLGRQGVSRQRKMKTLDDQSVQLLVERYRAGESASILATDFGVSYQTVYNMISRCAVAVRGDYHRLATADRLLVAEACLNGSTAKKAAEIFDISEKTVFRILRDNNVVLPEGRPRIYNLDESSFDTLTPESLYWMGFLFADGHVRYNGPKSAALIVGLAEKDRGHLEKFRTFLKADHPIRWVAKTTTNFGGACVYFSVRSMQVCSALTARGIVIKKIRVPVPELAASRDFWRGCIDGDGSLGLSVQYGRYFYPHVRLYGQRSLLETFRSYLIKNKLTELSIVPTKSGIWSIATTGSTARAIVANLYSDNTIALERKDRRAQLIIAGRETECEPYNEEQAVVDLTQDGAP